MAPHFGTYYWSKNTIQGCKNTIQGCQNTVQGCKLAFGTPFLATFLGVAHMHHFKVFGCITTQALIIAEIIENVIIRTYKIEVKK